MQVVEKKTKEQRNRSENRAGAAWVEVTSSIGALRAMLGAGERVSGGRWLRYQTKTTKDERGSGRRTSQPTTLQQQQPPLKRRVGWRQRWPDSRSVDRLLITRSLRLPMSGFQMLLLFFSPPNIVRRFNRRDPEWSTWQVGWIRENKNWLQIGSARRTKTKTKAKVTTPTAGRPGSFFFFDEDQVTT